MMYSSAIFATPDEPLHVAQERKLERICRKLDLSPRDRVIEIGSGWGGFALHAAGRHGCHVTTTTISREQFELASRRVQQAGLGDRITVLLRDYRDLDGEFDKLVSIEMIEAIGHHYLDTFFGKCASLLHEAGMALVQAITIEDHRYAQALRAVDFIKRYIFPGSFIPSVSAMQGALARASDLRLFHLEDIGPSYALTLRHWRQRFLARREAVRELGYPERFVRMWEFYLCYCEGGFLERATGDVQMLLTRPRCRRASFLPDLTP
jgi:cyclopropane-fatty-acyl-phospholipid synthase